MASRYVFDTGALSLHKEGDPRMKPLVSEVTKGSAEGIVVDLSVTELQYRLCQTVGAKAAEVEGKRIRNSRLRLVRNSPYLDFAWRFKCRYRSRFSLVDCVLLSVAQIHSARIVTTDTAFEGLREPRVSTLVLRLG